METDGGAIVGYMGNRQRENRKQSRKHDDNRNHQAKIGRINKETSHYLLSPISTDYSFFQLVDCCQFQRLPFLYESSEYCW